MTRLEKAYDDSLRRHYPWRPEVRIFRMKRAHWVGFWRGPYGGEHTTYSRSAHGVEAKVRDEVASWTLALKKLDRGSKRFVKQVLL